MAGQRLEALRTKANFWLLSVLLLLIPFDYLPYLQYCSYYLKPTQLVASILIVINLPLLWQKRNILRQAPWIFLGLFLIIAGTSLLLNGPNKTGLYTIGLYGLEFVLAAVVSIIINKADLSWYRNLILASAAFVATFGIWQFFADSLGVAAKYTLLGSRYTHLVFGYPRPHGFSYEPLFFAGILLIPAALALVSFVYEAKPRYFCLALLFVSVIGLSVSRSAYIALGLILAILFVWQLITKNYKTCMHILALVVLSSGIVASALFGSVRLQTLSQPVSNIAPVTESSQIAITNNTSTNARVQTWKVAIKQWSISPIIGSGPRSSQQAIAKAFSPGQFAIAGNYLTNNLYLEMLVEYGLLGIMALFGFIICLAWLVVRVLPKNKSKLDKIWIVSISIFGLGALVQWGATSNLAVTHTWLLAGLLIGLVGVNKIELVEKYFAKITKSIWLKTNLPALVIITISTAYYLLLELLLYRKFQLPMLDLGLFNRHMFGLAHFSLAANPLKGYNLLGDHSHFFLLPLAPLYYFWQKPEFLLVIQSLFIGLSGWPIYLIAKKYSPSAKLAALWLLPYFLFFGFFSAIVYPFHDSAAAVLPLAWVLYFLLVSKNYFHLSIASAVLLLFREDMPLVVIMVGLYLIIIERKYWLGLVIGSISTAYFLVATRLWLPMFGPSYGYEKTPFGDGLIPLAKACITQPWNVVRAMFAPDQKLRSMLAMLLSFGGFGIFAIEILILLLPFWLGRFLSVEAWRWAPLEHYSASQGPILAAASIIGLYRLISYLHQRFGLNKQRMYIAAICIATVMALGLNLAQHQNGLLKPLALKFYRLTPSELSAKAAMGIIPSNASVGAQSAFPNMSSRQEIYNLPLPEGASPEYIVLSPNLEKWPFVSGQELLDYKATLEARGYKVVFDQNDVFVLKKTHN